jgi:hypothetical protein
VPFGRARLRCRGGQVVDACASATYSRSSKVVLEEAGEGPVGEDAAARLAARAVVGLAVGVDDALHRGAAHRARLAVLAVDGHVGVERGHLLREAVAGLGDALCRPPVQDVDGGGVEALDLLVVEGGGHRHRRQPGPVHDLVGEGPSDPREQPGVGEGSLQRVPFGAQRRGEVGDRRSGDLEAAGVEGGQRFVPAHQMERGASLGPGFGQDEGPRGEVEGGEADLARDLRPALQPAEAARHHQVEDEVQVVVEIQDDPLAETAQSGHPGALGAVDRRVVAAQQGEALHPDVLEGLTHDPVLERLQVGGDLGKFRHGPIVPGGISRRGPPGRRRRSGPG